MIKCMTKEERKVYDHEKYLRRQEKAKAWQKAYYEAHKEEIKRKANLRYRHKVLGD